VAAVAENGKHIETALVDKPGIIAVMLLLTAAAVIMSSFVIITQGVSLDDAILSISLIDYDSESPRSFSYPFSTKAA